ncbi:nucleoside triphosphate pyrophosphohydrolase family protein [Solibacillus silvestris]|uniref:nucleoside triphosphate pyrophosphohydrolase family protein n=1 Tax=Solibacillus silvestris TaxID=76853 RepID=UPI003F818F0D
MKLNEYQELAKRTANHNQDFALANWGLGLTGEAGEVGDLIKKAVFHDHVIDQVEIKKELGDVLWYLAQIATSAGLSLEEVATENIEKLKRRYPDGFSTEASINRVDVKKAGGY